LGTRSEEIKDKCPRCKGDMKRVYLKNPYIDDFSEDCQNKDCYEFMSGTKFLQSSSRSMARQEHSHE